MKIWFRERNSSMFAARFENVATGQKKMFFEIMQQ